MQHYKRWALASGAGLAIVLGLGGQADAGFIFAQDGTGDVKKIDTSDGSTPGSGNGLGNVPGSFSPNALGFNGSFYRTSSESGSTNLFRGDTDLGTIAGVGDVFGGDVVGNTYYGIDNDNGNFFSISNVDGLSSGGSVSTNLERSSTGATSLGDIAIKDGTVFASSEDGGLQTFSLDGSGSVTEIQDNSSKIQKFAGLAFAGSTLFGVTGGDTPDTDSDLWQVGTWSGSTFSVSLSDTGNDLNFEAFDAAAVPLPAAAWLFLSGVAGVFGYTRYGRRKTPEAATA